MNDDQEPPSEESEAPDNQEPFFVEPSERLCGLRKMLETCRLDGKLKNICKRFLHEENTAEDAAGEVFLIAWDALASFRGEASFGWWLYTITRNHCFHILRMPKEESLPPDPLPGEPPPIPPPEIDWEELRGAIRARARARKPPWDFFDPIIFELRFVEEELTFREIAKILKKKEDTVKYRYYKCILPDLKELASIFLPEL